MHASHLQAMLMCQKAGCDQHSQMSGARLCLTPTSPFHMQYPRLGVPAHLAGGPCPLMRWMRSAQQRAWCAVCGVRCMVYVGEARWHVRASPAGQRQGLVRHHALRARRHCEERGRLHGQGRHHCHALRGGAPPDRARAWQAGGAGEAARVHAATMHAQNGNPLKPLNSGGLNDDLLAMYVLLAIWSRGMLGKAGMQHVWLAPAPPLKAAPTTRRSAVPSSSGHG